MKAHVERVRRCCEWSLLGAVPLLFVAFYAVSFLRRGPGESDFWTFWLAGRSVLHGHSPYPTLASLPTHASRTFAPFVYPPVAAFLLAPVAVLPFLAAKIAFLLVNLGALLLALRLLGVRDWRCYGVALASPPVIEATAIGTISIPLLLGVAAAWRHRDRVAAAGLLVGSVVTAKLFLWPVWFWLVRTRRWRAASVAVAASLIAVVAAWAAIGFAGLRDYPALLGRLTRLEGPHSFSTYSLGRAFGAGDARAAHVTYALGLVALAFALRFVRDDARSLAVLLGVAFVATPILWPHYLVLLFVPLALASRTFTRAWLLPVVLWADTTAWSGGSAWRIAGELVIAALAVAVALRPPSGQERPVAPAVRRALVAGVPD